jgi:hypothetical protein
MTEWIAVDRQLPEGFGFVVAWDNDFKRVVIAARNPSGSWSPDRFYGFEGGLPSGTVTHWMPLHSPPSAPVGSAQPV